MAATKSNRYWLKRTTHGRTRAFKDAEALWSACVDYFDWVEENPLYSTEVMKFQGEATLVRVPKLRAMTIQGLCLHIGITTETWGQYRKADHDFSDITKQVDMIIRTQKFEGAAADLFNASIIARDLGLSEKLHAETKLQADSSFTDVLRSISEQTLDLGAKA